MIDYTAEDIQTCKDAFAERLEELTGEKSSRQWSKENGIPNATVATWRLKQSLPKIEYFIAMAKHFGVSIDYLVGLED